MLNFDPATTRRFPTPRRPSASVSRNLAAAPRHAASSGGGVAIEALEGRQLLSVVYVSSSAGRDGNDGSSALAPVRSLAKAKSLIGNGDQLLLRAGDTWSESLGYWGAFNSTISAYGGGPRPRIVTGSDGISLARGVSNVTIRGISLNGDSSSRTGALLIGGQRNITFDNVQIDGFRNNITAQAYYAPIDNLTVRDSVITDSAPVGGHSSGIYADGVRGITIERNVFDGNGGRSSPFNHGVYVTALSSNLVARDNIFSNSSSHGMQARSGGAITGNLFANNSIGLSVGLVNGDGTHVNGGVVATVTDNVFTGGGSLRDRGIGMELGNIKSGVVADNLFLNGGSNSPYGGAISFGIGSAKGSQVGINNLTVRDNVAYRWGQGMVFTYGFGSGGGGRTMRNLLVANNDFQEVRNKAVDNGGGSFSGQTWTGNRAWGGRGIGNNPGGISLTRVGYPDASRTLATYDGNFFAQARSQAGAKYAAAAVTNYLKGGFGQGGGYTPAPTPTPPAATQLAGLTLINADSNASMGALTTGRVIDLGTTPQVNVRANPLVNVRSVSFVVDGVLVKNESSAPYALAGDLGGTFLPWTPPVGTHALSVIPHSGPGGTGTAGPAIELTFAVIDG